MKAMILAAGLGSRLQPITNKLPKPLIDVGGISLIESLINQLIAFGVNEFVINVSYLGSMIKKHVLEIKKNSACEMIWLLEHNSIFTAGTSAKLEDLKNSNVNFLYTGRGGQWTWHGPGQRVAYLMLNLKM